MRLEELLCCMILFLDTTILHPNPVLAVSSIPESSSAEVIPCSAFEDEELDCTDHERAALDIMTAEGSNLIPSIHLSSLSGILESQCALLCIPPCSSDTITALNQVKQVFLEDPEIFIGQLLNSSDNITWKSIHGHSTESSAELAFYEREIKDRTCLLSPPKTNFKATPYSGQVIPELLVHFLNEKCGTYHTISGGLNAAGVLHSYIMDNLYHLQDLNTDCLRIAEPLDQATFFQQFLFRSKPVVIEGGAKNWPAMKKWTMEHLRELYGSKKIHIKLTEDGNFEGVESAKLWEGYHQDWIPESVRLQLAYPDLVVVRPATAEMEFSDFLDFIVSKNRSYSAYLEYSSIPFHLPQLEADVREMPFLDGLLERRHLNMWLSDGDTLGKLHFDPFDNFLCQISGEKHLTLFEPHQNENLYEGHIPEAILSADLRTKKFRRKTLLESTSMVMSPVDISSPDLERFPLFAGARRTQCVLKPGDVLFMPAFWWHEVQSYPDVVERRNLAVNFWYEPLLTKEFPCAECRLHFNHFYRHFLYDPPL